MSVFYPANIQGELREAAAAEVRFISDRNGCLSFARPCGLVPNGMIGLFLRALQIEQVRIGSNKNPAVLAQLIQELLAAFYTNRAGPLLWINRSEGDLVFPLLRGVVSAGTTRQQKGGGCQRECQGSFHNMVSNLGFCVWFQRLTIY